MLRLFGYDIKWKINIGPSLFDMIVQHNARVDFVLCILTRAVLTE